MSRRNRAYKKGEPFRDASLFVIICEGEKREKIYFETIANNSQRIKVEILESKDGKSAPKYLLETATLYIEQFGLDKDDSLWFVLDIDKWTRESIDIIASECTNKHNWNLSISNPCFEVWLYLHVSDISKSKSKTCKELKTELHKLVKGGYNAKSFIQNLQIAIERAILIDNHPDFYYSDFMTTKVYKLVIDLIRYKNVHN